MANQKLDFQITAQDMFTSVMNGIIDGMAKAKQAMGQLGPAAKQAADQTAQAFKTLNIRSAFDIKAEQDKVIAAFNEIKNSGKASADEVARAQSAVQSKLKDLQSELNNTANAGQKSGATLGDVFKGVGKASFYFNNIKTAIDTAWQALMDVSGPAMEMNRLNAMFKASSGSAELAAKDLAYVRAESTRLGLVFQDTAGSFAKFATSTRNTALEGEKAKEVFSAVAEASTALQLSTDDTNGILLAFSQMLGKGRISAEELNQVAERLPGALDVISSAMGMTTREFKQAAEEGKVLSAEVLTKIPKALRDLYGAAAMDAADGPAAQLNRMKTALFDLMAVLGAAPMKVVGELAASFTWLANTAKDAAGWLSSSTWGQSLASLGAGLGFVATALTVAAGAQAIYAAATWAATTATGAFSVALLANPLVLAFGAAVVGVVAALSALADAFTNSSSASSKSSAAIKQTTEEMRKAAADRKQIEDNYEKAVGISFERQIEKRRAQLDQDRAAVEAKASQSLRDARGNAAEEQKIIEQRSADLLKAENVFYADIDKLRKDNLKKQEADANAELRNKIDHLKRLGQTRDADSLEIAARNQAEIKEVEQHYKQIEDTARANGKVLVGIDQERVAALDALRKKQALDAAQRGYEEGKKELDAYKAVMDSKAALMLAAAGDDVKAQQRAQVDIERMEIDYTRRRYQTAAAHFQDVAALYPKNSDQYRAALGDMTSAHQSYLDTSRTAYKKYADEIKAIDQQIKDFRLGIQLKIADLQQKTMTDQQKFADNQNRMNAALSKAEELKAAGRLEEAMKYNKQAEDLAGRLDSNVSAATAGLNRVLQQGESILEAQKEAPQAALNKLKELDVMPLKEKSLRVSLDEDALASVQNSLASLAEPATKIINVVYKSSGSSGESSYSDTPGYFEGGKIGVGSSLRDSVHAMLAKGEWVINNSATRFWGDGLMAAINAPFSGAGRTLQNLLSTSVPGPAVAEAGIGPNFGNINLTLDGGSSFTMRAPIDVLSELSIALRRRRMTLPQ